MLHALSSRSDSPQKIRCWRLPLLLLALFVGCSGSEERTAPEGDLGAARLLIVAFREKGRSASTLRWHYESDEGIRLSQTLEMQMSNNCPTVTPLSDRGIEDRVFHTDSDEVPWDEIGREVNATHVLTGRIENIRFRDPRTPGMLQGRFVVRWWVYRVSDGAQISSREFRVRIPEDPESGKIYVSFESSERELLAAMRVRMGQLITLTLCGEEAE